MTRLERSPPASTNRWSVWRRSLGPAAVLVGLVLTFFGRALFTAENFAFRDTAHYYYPQFAWEMRQWESGEWPLWNRQDNFGTPVAADPTACLFYPGKLLFALPISFDARFKLFVVSHLIGAAVSAYAMARQFGQSRAAATVCGMSYAFGGQVVFLYTNVVYLIGAAWLPLALLRIELAAAQPTWRASLRLAAPLALIMLGGDFHLAYHVVLLGFVRGLWVARRGDLRNAHGDDERLTTDTASLPPSPAPRLAASGSEFTPASPQSTQVRFLRLRIAAAMGAAAIAASLLAAAQIAPLLPASRDSTRAIYDQPRSLWELVATWTRPASPRESESLAAASLFATPPSGTHHEQIYWFSVGPWRWIEFLWPNSLGKLFPEHRRWGFAIPDEDRVWTPSLYQGVWPLLLAFVGVATAVRRRERALVTFAVGSLVASAGVFGIGWGLRSLGDTFGWTLPQTIGDPTGGLCWLLVTFLPGYAQFRYPAKWGVITALVLAALAATGFDRLFPSFSVNSTESSADRAWCWFRRFSAGAAIASGCGLTAVGFAGVTGVWHSWLADLGSDDWLGPFDIDGAWRDTFGGLATGFALAALAWWCSARFANQLAQAAWRSRCSIAVVAVIAGDLAIAHRWMIETAPPDRWQAGQTSGAALSDSPFVRLFPRDTLPANWSTFGANDRIAETVGWDAATLNSKLQLLTRAVSLDAPVVAESYSYKLLRDSLSASVRTVTSIDGDSNSRDASRWPELATWLGVEHGLAIQKPQPFDSAADSRGSTPATVVVTHRAPGLFSEPRETPRAWFARAVVREPDGFNFDARRSASEWRQAWSDYLRQREALRVATFEQVTVAWKECPDEYLAAPRLDQFQPAVELQESGTGRVTLKARTSEPRLLVLAERFHPDWHVRVTRADRQELIQAESGRVNWIYRGVWLPPGEWQVELDYRPRAVYAGLAISLLAWMAWLGCRRVHARDSRGDTAAGAEIGD